MQHTKPYSIQSPESVAKEYGGNKQKIAMAAQAGIIDPTVATMAGMFIDKMRSAAAAEQSAPQTVAQQVFAPPQPPPTAGVPPQAGLAAIQQGASPTPGPSASPPPSPGGAPVVGMAGGGLTTLPVPNDMFEEKSFAPGGIVAFAGGGARGDTFSNTLLDNPGSDLLNNALTGDATIIKQLIERAKLGDPQALSKLKLMGQYDEEAIGKADPTGELVGGLQEALQARQQASQPNQQSDAAAAAIPFEGSGSTATSSKVTTPIISSPAAKVDPRTQVPAVTDIATQMGSFENLLGAPPKPAYLDTQAADLEAQRKQDFWANMLAVGAGMAASKRGNFLGAVGESLTAATPQIQKSIENQRSAKREMQKAEYEYELAKYGVKGKALESAVNQHGKDIEHADRLAGIASEEARTQATLDAQARIAQAQMENALRIAKENKDTDAKFIINNNARRYMEQGMSKTEALALSSNDYISAFKQYGPNISSLTDLQVAEAKELAPLESARSKWQSAGLTDKVAETNRQIEEVKERYKKAKESLGSTPGSASPPSTAGSNNPTFSWNSLSGPGIR